MIQGDTIKLLRECDAGIKMGVTSIDEVLFKVDNQNMQKDLKKAMDEHERLGEKAASLLHQYQDEGKDPSPMAKSMSWVKSNVMMAMDQGGHEQTVAELITDGCNMGIKSLSSYLNEYKAADEQSKDIAKKLITIEEHLADNMRGYL